MSTIEDRLREALAGLLHEVDRHNCEYDYSTPTEMLEAARTLLGEHLGADQPWAGSRTCTCLGSCKGAAGLGPGWICALSRPPASEVPREQAVCGTCSGSGKALTARRLSDLPNGQHGGFSDDCLACNGTGSASPPVAEEVPPMECPMCYEPILVGHNCRHPAEPLPPPSETNPTLHDIEDRVLSDMETDLRRARDDYDDEMPGSFDAFAAGRLMNTVAPYLEQLFAADERASIAEAHEREFRAVSLDMEQRWKEAEASRSTPGGEAGLVEALERIGRTYTSERTHDTRCRMCCRPVADCDARPMQGSSAGEAKCPGGIARAAIAAYRSHLSTTGRP